MKLGVLFQRLWAYNFIIGCALLAGPYISAGFGVRNKNGSLAFCKNKPFHFNQSALDDILMRAYSSTSTRFTVHDRFALYRCKKRFCRHRGVYSQVTWVCLRHSYLFQAPWSPVPRLDPQVRIIFIGSFRDPAYARKVSIAARWPSSKNYRTILPAAPDFLLLFSARCIEILACQIFHSKNFCS